MVEIMKGKKRFRVPAGAVEVYKGMGFRVVNDSEPVSTPKEKEPVDTGDGDEDVTDIPGFDDGDAGEDAGTGDEDEDVSESDVTDEEKYANELLEKPISQWSTEEIKEFARIRGIDTSAAKKVSDARNIIKKYLDDVKKGE